MSGVQDAEKRQEMMMREGEYKDKDDGMMSPHGALYQCCVFVAAAGMHSGEKEGVE